MHYLRLNARPAGCGILQPAGPAEPGGAVRNAAAGPTSAPAHQWRLAHRQARMLAPPRSIYVSADAQVD
jgi:hypothetical protein